MKRSAHPETVVPRCHPVHNIVGYESRKIPPVRHPAEQIQSEISAFHREGGKNFHLEEIVLHHFPTSPPRHANGASRYSAIPIAGSICVNGGITSCIG